MALFVPLPAWPLTTFMVYDAGAFPQQTREPRLPEADSRERGSARRSGLRCGECQ